MDGQGKGELPSSRLTRGKADRHSNRALSGRDRDGEILDRLAILLHAEGEFEGGKASGVDDDLSSDFVSREDLSRGVDFRDGQIFRFLERADADADKRDAKLPERGQHFSRILGSMVVAIAEEEDTVQIVSLAGHDLGGEGRAEIGGPAGRRDLELATLQVTEGNHDAGDTADEDPKSLLQDREGPARQRFFHELQSGGVGDGFDGASHTRRMRERDRGESAFPVVVHETQRPRFRELRGVVTVRVLERGAAGRIQNHEQHPFLSHRLSVRVHRIGGQSEEKENEAKTQSDEHLATALRKHAEVAAVDEDDGRKRQGEEYQKKREGEDLGAEARIVHGRGSSLTVASHSSLPFFSASLIVIFFRNRPARFLCGRASMRNLLNTGPRFGVDAFLSCPARAPRIRCSVFGVQCSASDRRTEAGSCTLRIGLVSLTQLSCGDTPELRAARNADPNPFCARPNSRLSDSPVLTRTPNTEH